MGRDVRLQDRLLVSYYQTDAGPVPQKLTHLKQGTSTLSIDAPGYTPVSIPVTLGRGRNRLALPVRMAGREIPGLSGFSAFENIDNGDIVSQLRPLDAAGKAIVNHPCIDLWIGCVVSVQAGSSRGEVLFRGAVRWTWDAQPQSLFRYSVRIHSAEMRNAPSLTRIVDYLVVVPDPLKVSRAEVDRHHGACVAVRRPGFRGQINPRRGSLPPVSPRRLMRRRGGCAGFS